jgi:hypothetical protein
MKIRILHLVTILALLMAFAAVPVQAKVEKTQVSGVCNFLGEGDHPDNFRLWFSSHDTIMHFRNHAIVLECDLNDDRLDGTLEGTNNMNVIFGDPALIDGNDHADVSMKDRSGQEIWWGKSASHYYPDGSYSSNMILHGSGPNDGLVAHLTWTWNWAWSDEGEPYHLEGVIIE